MVVGINIGNSFTSIGLFKANAPEIYKYVKIANKELWDIKSWLPEIPQNEKVEAVWFKNDYIAYSDM